MRLVQMCLAGLLSLASACGDDDGAGEAKSADSAQAKQLTYADCMAVANRQASRAESVMKASECLRLPDAPPPGSTLPAGIPPPPGSAAADTGEISSV